MPQLHDYQELAAEYLRERRRAALFLDMGLGKTAISLSALRPESLPALVVAPKRVAEEVWHVERDTWRPDLTVTRVVGTKAARARALAQPADITVISRDNFADVLPHAGRWPTLIIDELSGYKSHTSTRFKTMRRYLAAARPTHVWGLTGTPAPNGLLDLWAQVYLLDGGARLGKRITHYRGRYFYPGRQLPSGVVTQWDLRDGADLKIHTALEDICLSMATEGRVQLPPVTRNPVSVPLPGPVRQVYKDLKADLVADLSLLGGASVAAAHAGAVTVKLSQLSAGFLYRQDDLGNRLPGYDHLHSEKITALKEIIDGTGSPVLVFYRFQAERDMILKAIPGAATIDQEDVLVRWNLGQVPVLLAHPASASHGLNLQHGGHTIVWTSLDWSAELWNQANKRLARQGQQHPVVIHVLLSPRTVDHEILDTLDGKISREQALLRHLESPL